MALLAGALAYWKWHSRPYAVEVATAVAPSAAQGPAAILQASGYVTARREATVSAQITGTVNEVLIEEGEHVKAGQVLARLDDCGLSGRRGPGARAAAGRAGAGGRSTHPAGAGAARYQRNQDLIDRNLVSRQALETAQTQQDTLAARSCRCSASRSSWRRPRCAVRRCSSPTARCARRLTA